MIVAEGDGGTNGAAGWLANDDGSGGGTCAAMGWLIWWTPPLALGKAGGVLRAGSAAVGYGSWMVRARVPVADRGGGADVGRREVGWIGVLQPRMGVGRPAIVL